MSKIGHPINFVPHQKESSDEGSSYLSDGEVYEIKSTANFLSNFIDFSNMHKVDIFKKKFSQN